MSWNVASMCEVAATMNRNIATISEVAATTVITVMLQIWMSLVQL
jgi:hypothetical protein